MQDASGGVRQHYDGYHRWLNEMPPGKINAKRAEADALFLPGRNRTFAVYGRRSERLIYVRHHSAHHPGQRVGGFFRADYVSASRP